MSLRRAKRVEKDCFRKKVRALHRERRQLWRATRDAEVVPLEKPYQRGWLRSFRWSETARGRKDFDDFEGLLALFQCEQWSRFSDFRPPRWLTWTGRMRWAPYLKFKPRELLRRCESPGWTRYFEISSRRPVEGSGHLRSLIAIGWGGVVRFSHPEWLVPRIEPFMVTHRRIVQPEAEARLAEIQRWIDRHGGEAVFMRALEERRWLEIDDRHRRRAEADLREVREELEGRGFIRAFRVWFRSELKLAVQSIAG
ncbi:hypothetical protein [Haloferula helveola]